MRFVWWIEKARNTLRIGYTYCFSTGTMVARTGLNVTFIPTLPLLFNIKVLVAPTYSNLIWTMFCFSFNKLGSNIIVFFYFVHHFYHKNLWFFQFNYLTSFFLFCIKTVLQSKRVVYDQLEAKGIQSTKWSRVHSNPLRDWGENLRAWVEWEYVKKDSKINPHAASIAMTTQ